MRLHLPKPGKYVVAVSGGLDSVCLLDFLANNKDYELVVAHYDHGIRQDSKQDLNLVATLASQYGLPFISGTGNLGAMASEAEARSSRYAFLNEILDQTKSAAIVTAHHQDDRLETAIINLIRGTGRLGLGSIGETAYVKRPFLDVSKAELRAYANQRNLSWREDSTNTDDRYLRNYIRLHLLNDLSSDLRTKILTLIDQQTVINKEIDELIKELFQADGPGKLARKTVNSLPYKESKELIATWLRDNNLINFDHRTIERLTLAAKTKAPGAMLDVYGRVQVTIYKEFLALDSIER